MYPFALFGFWRIPVEQIHSFLSTGFSEWNLHDWVDSDFSPFDVIHNRHGSVLDPLHAIVIQMEL